MVITKQFKMISTAFCKGEGCISNLVKDAYTRTGTALLSFIMEEDIPLSTIPLSN